jgi:hypothetical protein
MKKSGLLLLVVFLISAGFSFQQLTAQEKTKEEKEQEIKIQQTIDQQKRAMTLQKKAQEEALLKLRENQIELDKSLNEIEVEVDSLYQPADIHRAYIRRANRSFRFDEPFIVPPGSEPFYGHSFDGDTESTTWEFSKSVKENTLSRNYTFDVEKSAKSVVMSVMGDCKTGEIRVRIVMPNGKTYSDIVIDESGNLNWRKSFTITDTENQDKSGEWKFQIASKKATGYFKISLRTF